MLLADDNGAFIRDDISGVADVLAQLRIIEQLECCFLEGWGFGGFSYADAHWVASSSVDARISARCTVLTPVRWRCSPPKICMRQEFRRPCRLRLAYFPRSEAYRRAWPLRHRRS